jgi:hypothetical protein
MERAMARDGIHPNDRQLACARINSQEGQDYLVRRNCHASDVSDFDVASPRLRLSRAWRAPRTTRG